jgi:c-di-GMP-binding flagellar brake protein YcgR
MGLYDPLKVNQPVDIELPKISKNTYRSRVVGIYKNQITLAAPIIKGEVVSMSPGATVIVSYSDQIAIYSFESHVISLNRLTPATVTLGEPYDFKRTQRRNFVRLEVNLDIAFTPTDEDFRPVGGTCSGTTLDLSGGGTKFVCNTMLKYGDILDATVYLSGNDSVKAMGRVTRFVETPANLKQKYSVGLEFTVIEEVERDKIIKFIFNRQIELRKKGLL